MYFNIKHEDFLISRDLDFKNTSYLYGEVSHESLNIILKKYINDNSIFLDIGSGCGKIVIYISKMNDILADGIELVKYRFEKSIKLLDETNLHDKIEFINDDFKNLYFGNYNIIYCCNLIFSEKDNYNLYTKIKNEFEGIFILFYYDNILEEFLIDTLEIKTSWNKSQPIFIFQKN